MTTNKKPALLCTKRIDENLIQYVEQRNATIDSLSFIEIVNEKSIATIDKIQALAQENVLAIFTSSNAVIAVDAHVIGTPPWMVYCIGGNTKDTLIDKFDNITIKGFANTAKELAKQIIKKNMACTVYFFCGNKRMDYLPNILKENLFDVEEIVVYSTQSVEHKVEKEYDGILFFSPSAVKSFFAVNNIKDSVVLFAIGETTAAAIVECCDNKIIISDRPDVEYLIKEAVAILKT